MKGFRFYKKDRDLEIEQKAIRKTPNEAIADAFAMVGGAMKQAVEQYKQVKLCPNCKGTGWYFRGGLEGGKGDLMACDCNPYTKSV
jgi:hypothetical protein